MQRGVVDALRSHDATAADLVSRVPTQLCLAGMQFALRIVPGGGGIPAGPVEIAGAGGLTTADLHRIGRVTTREAHLAAFPEIFRHLVPAATLPDGWVGRLAVENASDCPTLLRLAGEDGASV
jgi:hypothetical protein